MKVIKLIREFRGRFTAQRLAREECQRLLPNEPVMGSALCANEPTRYVVRVFCGERAPNVERLPSWKECRVFAVPKGSGPIRQVDDEKYRPTIR